MSSKSTVNECGVESGLQLLSRLESRPSLAGLDNVIFGTGPYPNDIIEVTGDVSSGKTLLVTQLLANCLLPKTYCGLNIGGQNAGAVIIDTDHHFQILKLVNLMEACITRSATTGNSCSPEIDATSVENIIKDALDNLTVFHCYDDSQLIVTFHSLERILASNKNISLLVLDSISAFYWQNTLNDRGIRKMDLYLKKMLTSLQKHVLEFKVCIIYTKPLYFQSKIRDGNEKGDAGERGKISRQINLQKLFSGEKHLFCAHISSNSEKKVHTYEISDDGFKWHTLSQENA